MIAQTLNANYTLNSKPNVLNPKSKTLNKQARNPTLTYQTLLFYRFLLYTLIWKKEEKFIGTRKKVGSGGLR